MVWGLFPVDPLSGEDSYYIFAKGTYKVGRKGCDVIVKKDKGVSRIHAEIIVDSMISLDPQWNKSSNVSSNVRIRDCSKYGTFINKNLGSKEKLHEFPNKETTLKDGDLVSFGTGNATYRFGFVPLIFFVYRSEPFQMNHSLQDKISSIGASVTRAWSSECTHVLVDQFMLVKEDLVDIFLAKKPLVLNDWIEFVAEKNIRNEIPSCNDYVPTLTCGGVSVKVGDSISRENCLKGCTFLLEPAHKYNFGDRLQSLLEASGAKVDSIDGLSSRSQGLEGGENNRVVHVIPACSADKFDSFHNHRSVSSVKEMNLISAVISGHLDPSTMISPPVLVSSSCSTDETVVADSDAEVETATSSHANSAAHTKEVFKYDSKGEISVVADSDAEVETATLIHANAAACTTETIKYDSKGEISVVADSDAEVETATSIHTNAAVRTAEDIKYDSKREISIGQAANASETGHMTHFRQRNDGVKTRRDKVDESESGNPDVLYSQDLIVRDINLLTSFSSTKNRIVNFKCFRKAKTQSGNSFNNLIPFAKYPYKESDNGSDEVMQSVKEEKKRKQMEAIAEDLFNNEKGRRRGVAGSLAGLLTRGR
ncbi:nijmegen breakage syndrome 1 protein isoform X1 [Vitis riparia]|uniref:nijmegen breakage syndrome 1 protein isoform X1 n=1 Tax=Vitis riparia TaxID=96939 RepID=UPI00155B2F21|nr:nijmegen breakage syndrome 1 protein isoform X1 [Vitis riparia]XP_034682567.1 nijmegen breakage syndrome 1 protein isoform X1 [Vitis riparia]XP_034682568.1 nijmegen breakage syndrome 1 protein isoform X1 [Vitis riparia]